MDVNGIRPTTAPVLPNVQLQVDDEKTSQVERISQVLDRSLANEENRKYQDLTRREFDDLCFDSLKEDSPWKKVYEELQLLNQNCKIPAMIGFDAVFNDDGTLNHHLLDNRGGSLKDLAKDTRPRLPLLDLAKKGGAYTRTIILDSFLRKSIHLESGNPAFALLAIERGADCTSVPNCLERILHRAAQKGNVKIVTELLQNKKVNVNWQIDPKVVPEERNYPRWRGSTPLHAAAKYGHMDIVEMLLDAGADITLKSTDGEQLSMTVADRAFQFEFFSGKEEKDYTNVRRLVSLGSKICFYTHWLRKKPNVAQKVFGNNEDYSKHLIERETPAPSQF